MFNINIITPNEVVNFAAQELKKYLRMMMPNNGDITITYTKSATDGYNLGLMQDLDLDVSDVENGITAGTSKTTFSPNAICTRAQMVTFLWRCFVK